jgi:hypothetical protein
MNASIQADPQSRTGTPNSASRTQAFWNLDALEGVADAPSLDTDAACEFAHAWEEDFANALNNHRVAWNYKPRTFAVEWDEEGNFVDSFTPDFYLPFFNLFVQLVPRGHRETGSAARKVRLLRQQYPSIRIEFLRIDTPSDVPSYEVPEGLHAKNLSHSL